MCGHFSSEPCQQDGSKDGGNICFYNGEMLFINISLLSLYSSVQKTGVLGNVHIHLGRILLT